MRREQAPVPCTPAMASDHTLPREHAVTPALAPQQRAALGGEGDGTVPGSDQPQPSHVLHGTSGGLILWCPRVSPKSTSCACRQKTTLRTPRWRSSRGTAPHKKTSPAAQRTGGHQRVTTRKTTGDLATRRGAGDPAKGADWMTVLPYGHLWSAPVVVDACLRTEWEPPTLRAALCYSTRQSWRLLDGLPPLLRRMRARSYQEHTCSRVS